MHPKRRLGTQVSAMCPSRYRVHIPAPSARPQAQSTVRSRPGLTFVVATIDIAAPPTISTATSSPLRMVTLGGRGAGPRLLLFQTKYPTSDLQPIIHHLGDSVPDHHHQRNMLSSRAPPIPSTTQSRTGRDSPLPGLWIENQWGMNSVQRQQNLQRMIPSTLGS